jgi:hypothetical protein
MTNKNTTPISPWMAGHPHFCFGVVACLAAMLDFDACHIEIEGGTQPVRPGRGGDAGGAASSSASLWNILQIHLRDHRQAWDMRPDGSYVHRVASS